jgi:gas vesicle protein
MEQIEVNGINGKLGSSLALFLTGLGAGVALTVLLAPRSGAATRRLIGNKVGEGKGWVKNKAAAAQAYARGRGEELRDRAEEVAGELRGRAEEVAEVIGRPLSSDTARR